MYTCGLVLNNEQFLLGTSREALGACAEGSCVAARDPASVEHREHGCDACPPLMARRMVKHA